MKLTQITTFAAGCGLAAASAIDIRSLHKRWTYDVCLNDCSLAGIPMPDKNTFQLPLEGFRSEQCPPTFVGPQDAPLATSTVCLDFVGTYLYFNFSTFPGYTITSAAVTWELMGNIANAGSWSDPPPTTTVACTAGSGGVYSCRLAFTDILGVPSTTSIVDTMAGMCPNTDREGLGLYLVFSGLVEPIGGGAAIPFQQQFPCTSRDSDGSCTAWDTTYPYTEISYRCTNCNVSPAPPSLKTCGFGTAFGYENPVGGVAKSTTLNTQSGTGCNRWGWYETPTLSELQGGISGPLYVGAGGNDITKAVDVGIWVATANSLGRVTVTYLLNPPYALGEVHVDLVCLPLAKCAPGQYTYNAGAIPNLPTWSNPTPLAYPTCTGGSKAALIVHAAVNILTVTATCPPPTAV
ncbi:hypothetical protein B0T19DRAFT_381272 [Cercophora scortea]|uniref:Uncharacterized protein n=1 Tax=Cercophora scortea TaxID=314031 RepID=A0AAE0IWP0_9PEZI|nr:hypothetical protein B0T19DRAFT_381272 [Cercophora scortea]